MDRRNKLAPRVGNHPYGVEPLEERWLLSGMQVPVDLDTEPRSAVADVAPSVRESNGAVEVVELAVAGEDEEDDVAVAPSELPREIVAVLDARFPGAELIEAEQGIEDGSLTYDVTAEWDGQLIEVTFTTGGAILEMARSVTTGELPQPVLDWVRQNFPGAVIDEANLVTETGADSYELSIATAGQEDFEAILRVSVAATPHDSFRLSDGIGGRLDSGLAADHTSPEPLHSFSPSGSATQDVPLESETPKESESDRGGRQGAVAHGPTREQSESAKADSIRTVAEIQVGDAERGYRATTATDALTAHDWIAQTTHHGDTVRALAESAAIAGSVAWLPQVDGVLSDVLPLDVAAVERGLQQLLDEIDSLAATGTSAIALTSAALRLAVIAGLITGAELVILDLRRPNRLLVLESSAASSSWSWVLGTATPKRP